MRARTVVALAAVALVVGGLAAAALAADERTGVTVSVDWVGEGPAGATGNHHSAAAARIGGAGMVYTPVSGRSDTRDCALVAYESADGSERWRHAVPPRNCTVHAVADPTLADFDGDGVTEVFAATTERAVTGFHPTTGEVEFRHALTSYGYTRPLVADLVGDKSPEVIAVDVQGTVFVLRPNGTTAWSTRLAAYTWGQPAVADFDGDQEPELAVATGGEGEVYLFEGNGSAAWARPASVDGSVTWMATGQADDDAAVEVAVATASAGTVTVLDGATGAREWTRDLGSYAAVGAFEDGDGDGDSEVYAVARDGVLRSLDGATGTVGWTTTLTTADVQMMPPPALGDVDGDGDPELVAVTNDGRVAVVDPRTGAVLGTYEREVTIYADPVLSDTDGDGDEEAFVVYADGSVVALAFGRE